MVNRNSDDATTDTGSDYEVSKALLLKQRTNSLGAVDNTVDIDVHLGVVVLE